MNVRKQFSNMTETEYRALDAISYSMLTSDFFDSSTKKSSAFKIGSYIDDMLFGQNLDNYAILSPSIKVPSLTTNAGKFHKRYLELVNSGHNADMNTCRNAYRDVGIKKPTEDVFISDFFTVYADYDIFMRASKGKSILNVEEDMLALSIVNIMKSNPYVNKYFDPVEKKGIINLHQVAIVIPLVLNVEGKQVEVKVKCLLDFLRVDTIKKTIEPGDFKTMSDNTKDFKSSFLKWKYYIQSSLYKFILEHYILNTELKDYKVLDFIFIPVRKNVDYSNPLVYSISEEAHKVGLFGGSFKYSQYPVKGAINLIKDYLFMKNTGNFMYEVDVQLNKGRTELDV